MSRILLEIVGASQSWRVPHMNAQVRAMVQNCKTCKGYNQIVKPPMGGEVKIVRYFQNIYIRAL